MHPTTAPSYSCDLRYLRQLEHGEKRKSLQADKPTSQMTTFESAINGHSDDYNSAQITQGVTVSQTWSNLSAWQQPASNDAAFWWHTLGSSLATMLLQAGYSLQSQYEHLWFFHHLVSHSLGPRPTINGSPRRWKSFMTDDFSPLEYSWNWDGESPKVRYSIEPIGPDAGNDSDPFNQTATIALVDPLQRLVPNADWQLFYHFLNVFRCSNDAVCTPRQTEGDEPHNSSVFLAFELGRESMVIKAYFIPIKSKQTREPPLSVVTEGIRSSAKGNTNSAAHDQLLNFMTNHSEGSLLNIVGVAVDCVTPSRSRLKYYVRSPHTSFDSVSTMMTLGDKGKAHEMLGFLEDLHELWRLLLGLRRDFSASQSLEAKEHYTAGVLYNFDIRPGNSAPEPKVYIPVRHYARNDLEIAMALTSFLESRGRGQYVAAYMRVLEGLCTHRRLVSGCGLQTYISCGFGKGALSISSYMSPEIYHQARWCTSQHV